MAREKDGGAEEDRTPDLRIANATLSQLSYRPIWREIILIYVHKKKPPRMFPVLIIMAKSPLPGRCKTRMHARLGQRGAAQLQRNLIRLRIRQAALSGLPAELHCSPDIRHPQFLAARRRGLKLHRQQHGSLGRRMQRAQSRRAAVIVGTDSTDLDSAAIARASQCVRQGHDVIIPARDGGYVLLGLTGAHSAMFNTVNWGSAQVLRQTLRQHRRGKRSLHRMSSLNDLDHPADFARARRLQQLPPFGNIPF